MTVLISDSFNRSSTTTMGTPDNYNGGTVTPVPAWQYTPNSIWGTNGSQAYNNGGTAASNAVYQAYVDIGQSDVSVQVIVTQGTNLYPIVFRYNPSNNTGLFFDSNFNIKSFSGTSVSTVQSVSGKAQAAGDTVKVVCSGTSITVYQNGTQVNSGTSTINQTATCFGIGNWQQGGAGAAKWDNFEIDSLTTNTNVPLTSTVKSTSSATATPTLTGSSNTPVALSSTVKSSSSVISNIKNNVAVISSVKSNTSQTVTLKNSAALGTMVKSNTSVTSNVVNRQALMSTVKSNSSTTNTVRDAVALSYTNKSNTSATANISSRAQGSLSSVVKSRTSSTANLGITKPLSSTVKSSSTSSGTVTNNKPISSTGKSSSSSSANLTVGFVYIISTTKSRTSSTATAQSSLSLITNVKSKTTSHASLSFYTNTGPVVIHKAVLLYGSRQLHEIANGSRTLHEQLDGGV